MVMVAIVAFCVFELAFLVLLSWLDSRGDAAAGSSE